jgi:hypothetical protein
MGHGGASRNVALYSPFEPSSPTPLYVDYCKTANGAGLPTRLVVFSAYNDHQKSVRFERGELGRISEES